MHLDYFFSTARVTIEGKRTFSATKCIFANPVKIVQSLQVICL